ncbi:acyl-CoA dehydrogenase family protein [Williamsia maris]|uniref:Acyl-CoA dehydrogenase n=1 Tax=Williamsia maris TaxID=72806 RepID=A0ABT1HDF7_9NOCA|nr:acyl-CoA dehydrogenase family protein [Williamsia maris]MCP2175020.1 acyl-CoA dehydrogenase [Williamsia maris]
MSTQTDTTTNTPGARATDIDDVRQAGYRAAATPIGETLLVAGPLLRAAGLSVPEGSVAVAVAESDSLAVRYRDVDADSSVGPAGAVGTDTVLVVSGMIARVPWARDADTVIVLVDTPGGPVVFDATSDVTIFDAETDLAGNPLATLVFDGMTVADPAPVRREMADDTRLRIAAVHALLIAGAAERCAEMTVMHTATRRQFGRTLDHFQAVKQNQAILLEEVALVRAVSALAGRHLVAADPSPLDAAARDAVMAAVVQASASAGEIARLSHQLHGAIGFTELSELHEFTTRLWAWREAIDSGDWATQLGSAAIVSGADGLWTMITETTEETL